VECGQWPTLRQKKLYAPAVRLLLHSWQSLTICENGILKRKIKLPSGEQRHQLELPKVYRKIVLEELHCKMGHLGSERVISLSRDRFYWPRMASEIEYFIRFQCQCVKDKPPNRKEPAPLEPIVTTYPFEMVSIDFLHLETCKGG
jgi:hypothetical protein